MTTNKRRSALTKIVSIALIIFALLSITIIPSFAANSGTGTYTISTKAGLNVRSGAGQNYGVVGASPYGTKFSVSKTSGDWGYTNSIYCTNGYRSGWVNLNYAQKQADSVPAPSSSYSTGTYAINTNAGLNVRSGAGQNYGVVGAASKGVQFSVSKVNGVWGYTSSIKCTNGTRSGWVNLDYCVKKSSTPTPTPTPQPTSVNYTVVITTKAGLNMRGGPSQNYSVVVAIPYNTYLQITATQDGWGKTTYNGKSGWILLQYTQKVGTPVPSSSSISLNVPLYKQGDSRWSNVYIGNKTIGQVGCTTTCIAMAYSYNTGRTYYPNQVKSMLRYSNNDLYWSSIGNVNMTRKVYNRYADQSMLNDILNILKQGKPVIIGCNGASRGQHWVVIKGYNGNGLSASNFIINDPGSQNYSNLQQFLNYRGTVYGIVY